MYVEANSVSPKGNGGSLQHFPRGFCRKLAAIRSTEREREREYCSTIVAGKKVSSLEGCLLEGTKLEVVEMSLKIRESSSKRRSAQ